MTRPAAPTTPQPRPRRRHTCPRCTLFVVGVGWLLLPPTTQCRAQEPGAAQTATLTVTRRLVVLDAEITDKKTGEPVRGLQAADLSVLEDGQPRPIEHFEEHSTAATDPAERSKRIFLIDALSTPYEETVYAINSVQHLLDKQPDTLPEPTSIVVLDDKGLKTLAPSTVSRDALKAGLRSYRPGIAFALSRGDSEHLIVASVYTLRQLALANEGNQARNIVVWIGRGFPSIALANLPQEAAARLNALIENLTTNLLDARMTLSRVDTRPAGTALSSPTDTDLDDTFDTSPEPFADSFAFASLIDQTGGENLYNRNDVDAEVAKAASAGSAYYTIAYTPSPLTQDQDIYRHIRIVLHRPGLHVEARQGYFTQPPEFKALDAGVVRGRLDAAVTNSLVYSGLDLSVRVAMVNGDRRTLSLAATVPPGIRVPGKPLVFHVGIVRFDQHGKALSYIHTELHREPESVKDNSVVLTLPIEGPGKASRIRIVVLEPLSGDMGSLDLTGSDLRGLY